MQHLLLFVGRLNFLNFLHLYLAYWPISAIQLSTCYNPDTSFSSSTRIKASNTLVGYGNSGPCLGGPQFNRGKFALVLTSSHSPYKCFVHILFFIDSICRNHLRISFSIYVIASSSTPQRSYYTS